MIVRELECSEEIVIDVRCSFIVKDSLREGHKKKFSPHKSLKVGLDGTLQNIMVIYILVGVFRW